MTDLIWTPSAWLTLGVVLALLEVVIPGHILLGFGISALGVALVTLLIPEGWVADGLVAEFVLIVLWVGLALMIWYALSRLYGRRGRVARRGEDINDFENRG